MTTSRRFDGAARAIARLQRRLDGLERQASRQGHGHDALPLGVLGYAEVTSSQTGIGVVVTDLTGLTVTVDVAASRRIQITGHVPVIKRTSSGVVVGSVREGSTRIGFYGQADLGIDELELYDGSTVITPASGAHTYKLSLRATTDTVDTSVGASPFHAFILVEDTGAA